MGKVIAVIRNYKQVLFFSRYHLKYKFMLLLFMLLDHQAY